MGDSRDQDELDSEQAEEQAAESTESALESQKPVADAQFSSEIERSLSETEEHAIGLLKDRPDLAKSWHKAREIVEKFKPVPWFIWRISNYSLGTPGKVNKIAEGMLFGLKKLLCAAASDPFLGSKKKVLTTREALKNVSSDVIAAVSVIHAVNRRIAGKEFDRLWRPILDDAILRAQIGYLVGERKTNFGAGRGMLAGFAGRIGLVILIASGTQSEAQSALEMLAGGQDISEVGTKLYGCDPLQVSAMILSAAGCGKDAAFGTVSYLLPVSARSVTNYDQRAWLAAFEVTERVRIGNIDGLEEKDWNILNFVSTDEREDLLHVSKDIVRRGHGWNWIL